MCEHPLYNTWRGMIERCSNKNSKSYERYGKKGITVFDGWTQKERMPGTMKWSKGFCEFLEYVENNLGAKPENHSLDRIYTYGNYEPGNLRWADPSLQKKNQKRKNISGYKYVYSVSGSDGWQADFMYENKRYYVGYFKLKEDAYYEALARRLEVIWNY